MGKHAIERAAEIGPGVLLESFLTHALAVPEVIALYLLLCHVAEPGSIGPETDDAFLMTRAEVSTEKGLKPLCGSFMTL